MNCSGMTVKNTCGVKQYATCVYYEGEVPDFSSLVDDECVTVEEVIDDVYELVGNIRDSLDFTDFESNCISYPSNATLTQVITAQANKICSLQTTVDNMAALIATMQQQITELQNNICQ